jgi:phage FluMu protein gp41
MSELTVKGALKVGLSINGELHKDFELREALAGDIFAAEDDATGDKPTTFRAAILARQLVHVGSYKGPFSIEMLGKLKGRDLSVLLTKQRELDALGEGEQLDAPIA